MKTSLSILLAVTLAQVTGTAQEAEKTARFRTVALTATETKKHHFAPVTVEGKKQSFIVDTGFGGEFVFAKSLATDLAKKLTPKGNGRTVAGEAKLFTTNFSSVHFGEVIKLKNQTGDVADLPSHLNLTVPGEEATTTGGLIGSTFFLRSRAIISYKHQAILIPPNGVAKEAYTQSRRAEGDRILKLTPGSKNRPFIQLTIQGKDYHFLVDTAAGSNLILPELVEELGLETKETNSSVVGGGDGQATNLRWALVDNVTFGGTITLPKFDFYVLPNHAGVVPPEGTTYGGILGSSLLRQLNCELDFGSYTMLVPRRKK